MKKHKLFWIDLETTGLDPVKHGILELACIVTDIELNPLESYESIVFQSPEVLALMDAWCQKTHGESGLTKAVATGKPLAQVEQDVLELLGRHFSIEEKIPLAGNSVNFDRQFLLQHCPKLSKRLHYRVIDVSSFKELLHKMHGVSFENKLTHRAMEDIQNSVKELKYYIDHFFI